MYIEKIGKIGEPGDEATLYTCTDQSSRVAEFVNRQVYGVE